LHQVFQNLLSNALKYRDAARAPRIDIDARREDGNYIFSVQDNGIGVDEQYFGRIFEIFRRLHREQEYPGTGVGLSVANRIVERHGVRMWVESTPSEGSTFFFTLPDSD
jgi:light-regulated signal transduction histidine kinase (bacteriophytochrome)